MSKKFETHVLTRRRNESIYAFSDEIETFLNEEVDYLESITWISPQEVHIVERKQGIATDSPPLKV